MGNLFEDYTTAKQKPENERNDAEKALISRVEAIRQKEIAKLGKKE